MVLRNNKSYGIADKQRHLERWIQMERVYKAMKSVGSFNIVVGILLLVGGIAAGTAIIAKGANLLRRKSDILF